VCCGARTVAIHSLAAIPGEHATRAPKWLRRSCGASFGFGGKLVTFSKGGVLSSAPPPHGHPPHRGVFVTRLPADNSLVASAAAFEKVLSANDLPAFCEEKVGVRAARRCP
jgi:protein transport protein SEC31